MNREIKFRGKRIDNGEWVCGHYSHLKGKSKMLIDRSASNSDDWIYQDMDFDIHLISEFIMPDHQGWDYGTQCRFHKVIPESIGLFTDVKYHDGEIVCEGDVIETITVDGVRIGPSVICFGQYEYPFCGPDDLTEYGFGFYFKRQGWASCSFSKPVNDAYYVKLGNIYENPGLLK